MIQSIKMNSNIYTLLFILLMSTSPVLTQTLQTTGDKYIIEDNQLIPTRDGSFISAIVVRKKINTTPLPAALFYTTYQSPNDANFGKKLADRDYVSIITYARGIKTDISQYKPYENEQNDIYDIIDWISKQNWCNGAVGMYGGSYTGFSQWSTVKMIHPALKTIVPQVAVMPGYDFPMENNIPLNNILSWPNDNIYKREPLSRGLSFEWFEKGTSFRSLDSLAGRRNAIFQKWMQHPDYDTYWQSLVPTPDEYKSINIPILTTTGYYDGCQISALQYFKLHTKYNPNANHYVVIGPYDHWGGQRKAAANLMEYIIDPAANIAMEELAYQWLDYILKGANKPDLLKDRINYQVMGTNEWKHAPSLNKMNNGTLKFFLSDIKQNNSHNLSLKSPKKKTFIQQTVDFKDRENQNSYYTPQIVFDSLDTGNGLVFTSESFKDDFTINGSFTGNLITEINKKDMDVSLALYELDDKGKYFFITRYVGRASYAKNNSKRQLLQPGKKESIPFNNTRLVSKKISKGSRFVVLLNINKHPFEIINYGSGKDVYDETIKDAGEPLQIKWFSDSFIEIPIFK